MTDQNIKTALEFAFEYGNVEGQYHKQWVINEMIRSLLGSQEAYEAWIHDYEKALPGSDAEGFEWDKGIAP